MSEVRLVTATQFPADGPDQHFVERLWKPEGGPVYHDHVAGPFGTAEEANEALARLEGDQAEPAGQNMFREGVSIIVVGLLLAVLMVDAVVGMSSGFTPTEASVVLAELQP